MPESLHFPFRAADQAAGEAGLLPFLPITLDHRGRGAAVAGLVDTGATVNVMPYRVGLDIGAVWDEQSATITLSGNLAHYPARALVVLATVGQFPPVRLAFAWTQADNVPLLLGQINFFMEFDVCFFHSQRAFEVKPKT